MSYDTYRLSDIKNVRRVDNGVRIYDEGSGSYVVLNPVEFKRLYELYYVFEEPATCRLVERD